MIKDKQLPLGKGLQFILLWMLCWGYAFAGSVPISQCSVPLVSTVNLPVALNTPAKGLFLVASKKMRSPVFSRTVILLVKAGKRGALGVVINSPTPHTLGKAVPQLKGLKAAESIVFSGGPVEPGRLQVLFRSASPPSHSGHVLDDVYFSGSERMVLEQAGTDVSLSALRFYAGYAGWAPGQLEQELERGGWHLVPADSEILFREKTEDIWQELLPAAAPRWVRADRGDVTPPSAIALLGDYLHPTYKDNLLKLALQGFAVEVLHH